MCLSLLVFTHCFSKVARSEPAKLARKQNLTRNGHSRSCNLGSLKSWWRTVHRYIITMALSLKFPKTIATEYAENCHSRQPHCRLTSPPHGTSGNISATVPVELELLAYINFVLLIVSVVWVYLHSTFCGGHRKTHLFCNRVRISHSVSSKVIDFGTNWNPKGLRDCLLVSKKVKRTI